MKANRHKSLCKLNNLKRTSSKRISLMKRLILISWCSREVKFLAQGLARRASFFLQRKRNLAMLFNLTKIIKAQLLMEACRFTQQSILQRLAHLRITTPRASRWDTCTSRVWTFQIQNKPKDLSTPCWCLKNNRQLRLNSQWLWPKSEIKTRPLMLNLPSWIKASNKEPFRRKKSRLLVEIWSGAAQKQELT